MLVCVFIPCSSDSNDSFLALLEPELLLPTRIKKERCEIKERCGTVEQWCEIKERCGTVEQWCEIKERRGTEVSWAVEMRNLLGRRCTCTASTSRG